MAKLRIRWKVWSSLVQGGERCLGFFLKINQKIGDLAQRHAVPKGHTSDDCHTIA